MFGLFEKRGEAVTAETIPANGPVTIDMDLTFEAEFAVLSGNGIRFRLSKETIGILTDRSAMAARFREAEAPVERREWNDEARALFCKIGRLLTTHGLNFHQIGKILSMDAGEARFFWGWAVNLVLSRQNPAAEDLSTEQAADDLDLIPERCFKNEILGGITKKIRLTGFRVAELLREGSVKSAAATLGVDPDDLQRWIDVNSKMLEVLK